MTPRRRRPDTPDAPHTRRPDTPSGDDGPRRGGDDVTLSSDGITTMADRLRATSERVDTVTRRVENVQLGPEAMGMLGTNFTGAARSHMQVARDRLGQARDAVGHAEHGTRRTAQSYVDTDESSATSLSSIDTHSETPNPGGSSTTTPSSATGTATPPAPPMSDPGPGSGSGANPPPPPDQPPPPGGGTPRPAGPGSSPPSQNPFNALVRQHFNDSDYATFEQAMDKMSQDPTPGQVPGVGRLTDAELETMARARALAEIQPGTIMSKTFPPGAHGLFFNGEQITELRGFQARADDLTHLRTPEEIRQGLRLDYSYRDRAGDLVTPFPSDTSEVFVVEYPAGDPSRYTTPVGGTHDPTLGQTSDDPDVIDSGRRMVDAAYSAGYTPDELDVANREWPNTGTGVTGHATLGVPEFTSGNFPIPNGALAYHVTDSGRLPIAVYDEAAHKFIPLADLDLIPSSEGMP